MKVEVCFTPALYKYYQESKDKIVVVTDIFRASTTMCAAFRNGARAIIPVASINEAKAYKEKGYKVGAERNVKRCDFADFGNAPSDYTEEKVKDEDIVFTTTNGTQAIDTAADDASCLLVGAFSNLNAVADFCIKEKKDVMVLCAGWENRFNIEDTLFGGALAKALMERGNYTLASDAAHVALSMWKEAENSPRDYVERSEHIKRLEANGLADAVDYCLTIDTVPLVPIFDKKTRKLTI